MVRPRKPIDAPEVQPRRDRTGEDGESTLVAFEAIHALPGFCRLLKRSPTLDGDLPLRAAQHCSPVFEGNAAGLQISLEQPMQLRRIRSSIQIDMTPPAFKQTQQEVRGCIERLVRLGLLTRGGYWHRLLARDAIPVRGLRILLWSGFLVRPAEGVCLHVGPAFNRRSRILVQEHAIVDRSGFTPLMLEIDGGALGPEPKWVEGEVGCVLPVAPHARMTLGSVRRFPEVVAAFESFYDSHYFEKKATRPTSKYRTLMRRSVPGVADTCHAKVAYAGPAVHSISTLNRFHHPLGVSKRAPKGVSLPRCAVANIARLEFAWDGQHLIREKKMIVRALRALEPDWRSAGGDTASDAYKFFSGYFFGSPREAQHWQLQPWVFSVTPPGWSTVVDGLNVGGSDGMRGIVRTDQFHAMAMVYRMYAPMFTVVPNGAPMLRFFPIPRSLQDADVRMVDE